MINVHGGEMTVVGGRYGDAVDAFEAEAGDAYSLAPFDAPFRVEGAKTVAYEVCEQLDWQAPDAIVYPTGHGESLVGIARGFRELRAAGRIETLPRLVLAQAEGCAPLVKAWDEGQDRPTAWDRPDTICGPLEVPEPDSDGGALALDAVAESNGIADVAADADALAAAVEVAGTVGVEMSATGGVAAAVTQSLAEDGTLSPDDTVVAVNPLAGEKEADVLRSHLMSKGI
jgi:threonine synthase